MNTILFILICYGLSNIIIYGSIFNNPRNWLNDVNPNFFGKLFTCMMCTPWWVGFSLSLGSQLTGYTQFSPFYNSGLDCSYISIFLDACLISGTTWLIHTIQEHLEA